MAVTVLTIQNGVPHLARHETFHVDPQSVEVEMLNVLMAPSDMMALKRIKSPPNGRILGNMGVGKITRMPLENPEAASRTGLRVGQTVLVGPTAPCGVCSACAREHWEECAQPQIFGVSRDGVCASRTQVPIGALTRVESDPQADVHAFLAAPWVAKGVWLATQPFANRDNIIGAIGPSCLTQLFKDIMEDFSNAEVERVQPQGFLSAGQMGAGRFDVLIDDSEAADPETVMALLRPTGLWVRGENVARTLALTPTSLSVRESDLKSSSLYVATEWIAQNLFHFSNIGAGFPFTPEGLMELTHSESLRQRLGFLFFEMRPEAIAIKDDLPKRAAEGFGAIPLTLDPVAARV